MPDIKVLHLIPTLSSGGAERQLVNLVCTTRGIEHIIAIIGFDTFYEPLLKDSGVRIKVFGITRKRPFLQAARMFRELIRKERPSLINSWLYDANVSARLGNLGLGYPVVTSLQSPDYDEAALLAGGWSPYKVRILKEIDKFSARLCNQHYVACSVFVNKSYIEHFGIRGEKTSVIYNAVDFQALATGTDQVNALRNELSIPDGAFVFTNVGRLDRAKNQKVVIDAFNQIVQKYPNTYLLLVGSGPLEEELGAYVHRLRLSERVMLLGRRDDIGAILESADVFVFPSLLEGLPVALVEAMYKSLPCIASRIDVFSEVIEDGKDGLLIDPNSPEELARAMIDLYENEELRRSLGMRAFEKASERFDAATTARQWEEFYLKVAQENSR